MTDATPSLTGVYIFVRDMPATLVFYRQLGLILSPYGENFASVVVPEGAPALSFGTQALTESYDSNWKQPGQNAKSTLNFTVATRDAVDDLYTVLTAAGYYGQLPPIDAFWGSRFAVVHDPDGNQVGLQSPQDPSHAFPPTVH